MSRFRSFCMCLFKIVLKNVSENQNSYENAKHGKKYLGSPFNCIISPTKRQIILKRYIKKSSIHHYKVIYKTVALQWIVMYFPAASRYRHIDIDIDNIYFLK